MLPLLAGFVSFLGYVWEFREERGDVFEKREELSENNWEI